MARDNKGFLCHIHDTLVSYEIHHVWPREYHGPDRAWNRIKICCNAHSDIHWLMNRMLAGKEYNLSEYGPNIRKYAKLGYDQVMVYVDSLIPKEGEA